MPLNLPGHVDICTLWVDSCAADNRQGQLVRNSTCKVQIKHIRNSGIKNFGPLSTLPCLRVLMFGLFLYLEGKEAPNINNLGVRAPLGRGSGWGA